MDAFGMSRNSLEYIRAGKSCCNQKMIKIEILIYILYFHMIKIKCGIQFSKITVTELPYIYLSKSNDLLIAYRLDGKSR